MKHQNKITFAGNADALSVALAQLGQSDSVIEKECGLTPGQISYRLRKAKDLMKQQDGFRTAWRKGESKICQMVKADVLAIIKKDIQRKLPVQIEHLAGEVVKK